MKKLNVLLTLVIAAGLLAACGDSTGTTSQAQATPTLDIRSLKDKIVGTWVGINEYTGGFMTKAEFTQDGRLIQTGGSLKLEDSYSISTADYSLVTSIVTSKNGNFVVKIDGNTMILVNKDNYDILTLVREGSPAAIQTETAYGTPTKSAP